VPLTLVTPGSGAVRDLVIAYHVAPLVTGPKIAEAAPEACVLVEMNNGLSSAYELRNGLVPLPEAVAKAKEMAGEDFEVGLLILVGFSAGCEALRQHLNQGYLPSVMLALDGTHASSPPNPETQLQAWQVFCQLAKDEQRVARITHTQIDTYGYLPTKVVAPMLAEIDDAPAVASDDPMPHTTQHVGWLWLDAYEGKVGDDHNNQQRKVLEPSLAEIVEVARQHRDVLAPHLDGGPLPDVTITGSSSGGDAGGGGEDAGGGGATSADAGEIDGGGGEDDSSDPGAPPSFLSRHRWGIGLVVALALAGTGYAFRGRIQKAISG